MDDVRFAAGNANLQFRIKANAVGEPKRGTWLCRFTRGFSPMTVRTGWGRSLLVVWFVEEATVFMSLVAFIRIKVVGSGACGRTMTLAQPAKNATLRPVRRPQ
jgi:hypothetical protein